MPMSTKKRATFAKAMELHKQRQLIEAVLLNLRRDARPKGR